MILNILRLQPEKVFVPQISIIELDSTHVFSLSKYTAVQIQLVCLYSLL